MKCKKTRWAVFCCLNAKVCTVKKVSDFPDKIANIDLQCGTIHTLVFVAVQELHAAVLSSVKLGHA